MIALDQPFNLDKWIDEHADDLKPPVANQQIWADSEMIVMIVGGGNERTDFHDDPLPEFFHQLRGDMNLRLWPKHGSAPQDMVIRQGDVYMLGPHVRHSPQRPDPTSIGLVVEYNRPTGQLDGFEWACASCHGLVHRTEVQLASIVEDLPPLFDAFYNSGHARTCPHCGTVHPGLVR